VNNHFDGDERATLPSSIPSPDMTEQAEIGGTEIVLLLGTSKPEAPVLQVAHRAFLKMANAIGLATGHVHRERILPALDQPACNFSSRIRQLTRQ
jgi:hypothetical protein